MSTSVTVNTYTHAVTYVADNIFKSLKDILRLSGLSPENLVGDRESIMRALTAWLNSKHLERISLEIYNPKDDSLITSWDVEIKYGWSSDDGGFWTDTDQLRYEIKKAGVLPSDVKYDIRFKNKTGRPDVLGWSLQPSRSREGFVQKSLGSTVSHSGLGGSTSVLRKAS